MSLVDLALSRRLIIVTGKGGVGKSTLTAALAHTVAARGRRVLCAEIVPLPDTPSALHVALGGPRPTEEPALAADNLWVTLLTPSMGHLRFLQDALPIRLLADAAMRSQGLKKFLAAAPGFSDMGVMYRMLDLMRRQHPRGGPAFETCIIDSPATGHALALAQIPEFLVRVIPAGPIYRVAKQGVEILSDPKVTGSVIVTLPETLPVTEAMELQRGLQQHGLPVASIVVNRIPRNPFSTEERAAISELFKEGAPAVYGARELRRIERAEAALRLLRETHGVDYLTLPEVEGSGPDASRRLAAML